MLLSLLTLARYRLRKHDIERAAGSRCHEAFQKPRRRHPRAPRRTARRRRPHPRRARAELRLRLGAGRARRAGGTGGARRAAGQRARPDDVQLGRDARARADRVRARAACTATGRRDQVVGTVTTGGTESCLLAVKTARDVWLAARGLEPGAARPRLIAPTTVHAAFQKAAHYFGLELDLVPVEQDGAVVGCRRSRRGSATTSRWSWCRRRRIRSRRSTRSPRSPAACLERGIPLHVDACIGGLVLPFWPGLPAWDFAVPGVTSISADLHKFGYAPKGVSVLLQRGRDRQRDAVLRDHAVAGVPGGEPDDPGLEVGGSAGRGLGDHRGARGVRDSPSSRRRACGRRRRCARRWTASRACGWSGTPVGPLLAVAADAGGAGGRAGRPAPLGGRRARRRDGCCSCSRR